MHTRRSRGVGTTLAGATRATRSSPFSTARFFNQLNQMRQVRLAAMSLSSTAAIAPRPRNCDSQPQNPCSPPKSNRFLFTHSHDPDPPLGMPFAGQILCIKMSTYRVGRNRGVDLLTVALSDEEEAQNDPPPKRRTSSTSSFLQNITRLYYYH